MHGGLVFRTYSLERRSRRHFAGTCQASRPSCPSSLRSRLPSVLLRCVRVVRTNFGFRARPKHFSQALVGDWGPIKVRDTALDELIRRCRHTYIYTHTRARWVFPNFDSIKSTRIALNNFQNISLRYDGDCNPLTPITT